MSKVIKRGLGYRLTLDVPNAAPYEQIGVPQMPIIHPYNPTGSEEARNNGGIPTISIAARLPKPSSDNLPPGVKKLLESNGLTVDNLDVFFCVQDKPWAANEQLLLRPHGWVHSDAPQNTSGKGAVPYNRQANIQAGIALTQLCFHPLIWPFLALINLR